MAPHGSALPQAATESAKAARKNFFCELCQKGYDRMNDFEAHEGSYDHLHRKRLKDLKHLTKDPNAAARARESEARMNEEGGLKSVSISLPGSGSSGPVKKKPVFKSTLQPQNASVVPAKPLDLGKDPHDSNAAVANGWANDQYDPTKIVPYDDKFKLTDIMTKGELRDLDAEIADRKYR
ncbi:hypothetical protein PRZ48_015082 [Zasmidium cellare]|uniref:C2H2-type domain-containing protein n=1 Tax=Zasmidium cellare TaxID=395010 RepID=A0ABR0DXN2_ZASCE|nr:hypothetical protein PRZ48_015082 [Zasmidium cellare]